MKNDMIRLPAENFSKLGKYASTITFSNSFEKNCNLDASGSLFSNSYENGYRFYLHSKDEVPYLASEGVSASPRTTVYSAMQKQKVAFSKSFE